MDLAKITRLARRRYRQVVGESKIAGIAVPIACYLDEQSYCDICDDELTFFEHWAMLALFAEMVSKRGAIVVFVPLIPADFFKWCKKYRFNNSPQVRARYVSWLISGEIKGPSMQIDEGVQDD